MDYTNGSKKTRTFSTRTTKPEYKSSSTVAHFSQPNPEEKTITQRQRRTTTITSEVQRYSRISNNTPSTLDYSNFMKNTYQLADQNLMSRDFNTKDIRNIIQHEFETVLTKRKYCPVESPKLAVVMSDRIKHKIMARVLNGRYRVLTSVFLTNEKGQGMRVVSKGLLANSTDAFESFSWSNSCLHAVAVAFVVYLE